MDDIDRPAVSVTRPGGGIMGIELDRERVPLLVLLVCFGLELLLFLLDAVFNVGGAIDNSQFRKLWKPTLESSFASFFSIAQTVLSAATLWLIVAVTRLRRDGRRIVLGWAVLAAFFTFMAADDGAKFHERMGTMLGESRDIPFPSYNWQFFFLPFFGMMGLFLLVFIWMRMRDRRSRVLIVTAIAMLVCAVGIDFIEGLPRTHPWNVYNTLATWLDIDGLTIARFDMSGYKTVQHFAKSAEEIFFEAGANSVMWYLFLRYLLGMADELRLRTLVRC